MPVKRKAAAPEPTPASPQKKQVVDVDAPKSTRKRKTGETKATPNKTSKTVIDEEDEPTVSPAKAPDTPKAPKSSKKSEQPSRRKSVGASAVAVVATSSETPSTNKKPSKPVKSEQKATKPTPKSVKKVVSNAPPPTVGSPAKVVSKAVSIPSHSKIVQVEEEEDDDEIVGLWHQSWTAFHTCLTTVAPLFLTIVLFLYVFAKLNNSQLIASIGLVYFFVCLLVLGTYFFAVAPFILVSNAINSFVNGGKTVKRDFVRVGVLLALIASAVTYFTHFRQ